MTVLNSAYMYVKEELGKSIRETIFNFLEGDFLDTLFGENTSLTISFRDMIDSIDENFENGHSIDYSMIATMLDFCMLLVGVWFPHVVIGPDQTESLIKKILSDIDLGNLLGL